MLILSETRIDTFFFFFHCVKNSLEDAIFQLLGQLL